MPSNGLRRARAFAESIFVASTFSRDFNEPQFSPFGGATMVCSCDVSMLSAREPRHVLRKLEQSMLISRPETMGTRDQLGNIVMRSYHGNPKLRFRHFL